MVLTCPLCGRRNARRSCPALGKTICAVCCGTKRLTEIRCPPECPYLAVAREHPPAVALRQRQHDAALVLRWVRDFGERQSQLFLLVGTYVARYQSGDLHTLLDDDVAAAARALAATFETASRGVIYEHRPPSVPAERLLQALKPILEEASRTAASGFDRDAATVLRQIEQAAGEMHAAEPGNRRALVDLFGRIFSGESDGRAGKAAEAPRLIVS